MAVSEDGSTPAVATTAGGSTATSLTTASFSPPSNTVLVALCIINWSTYPGVVPNITVSDTASGTWTAGPVVTLASSGAKAAMFTRPAVSGPGSITCTMSRGANNTAAELMLAVRVCDGAKTSGPQGANNTASGVGSGAGTHVSATITPNSSGSLVYVVGGYANNNSNAVITGTSTIQSSSDSTDGGTLLTGKSSATTTGGVAQEYGWTANITSGEGRIAAVLEILPSSTSTGTGLMAAFPF